MDSFGIIDSQKRVEKGISHSLVMGSDAIMVVQWLFSYVFKIMFCPTLNPFGERKVWCYQQQRAIVLGDGSVVGWEIGSGMVDFCFVK